jgi:hypothetical protein
MHVVGVAAVGREDRDDRLERGRPQRRDLKGVEAGVRRPVHPDRAVAPVPRRQPVERLEVVLPLAVGVLVLGDALGRARPADVGAAHREISLVDEPAVDPARPRQVVLPVRPRLEHDGPRALRLGQVQRQRDPHAVGHPDEHVLLGHRVLPSPQISNRTSSPAAESLPVPRRFATDRSTAAAIATADSDSTSITVATALSDGFVPVRPVP